MRLVRGLCWLFCRPWTFACPAMRALQAKALADAGEIRPTFKTFRLRAWLLAHGHQVPPQMPDENHRRYLFVAIDRATRCSPITAASSRIASPAKNTNLQEPTSLICVAKPSISNTVYVRRATRRLMAWSSDSMPESAKWSIKPVRIGCRSGNHTQSIR